MVILKAKFSSKKKLLFKNYDILSIFLNFWLNTKGKGSSQGISVGCVIFFVVREVFLLCDIAIDGNLCNWSELIWDL